MSRQSDDQQTTRFHKASGRFMTQARVNGRRVTAYGKTEKEALANIRKAREQAARDGGVASGATFGALTRYWLDNLQVREKTRQNYTGELAILTRFIGDTTRLKTVTPTRIESALNEYRNHPRTRQLLYLRLRQLFVTAVRLGWLPSDTMARVTPPKHTYHRADVWSAEDVREFLARSGRWRPLWLLALATGARIGELRALQWRDVDLDSGVIRIERTIQRVNKRETIGLPKTAAGVRCVSLPHQAVAALLDHRERQQHVLAAQGATNPDGWLWLTDEGRPATYRTILAGWQRDTERAGLTGTPHLLRHVHASALLAGGLPVPEVAKRLGHANSAVTLAVYSHALPGNDRGAKVAEGFLTSVPALSQPA